MVRVPNITFSLPEPLYTRMRQFPWVKWSEVARSAFGSKLTELESMPKRHRMIGMPVKPGRVSKKVMKWIDYPQDDEYPTQGVG